MTPVEISRRSNRLHDEFTKAAGNGDQAAMARLIREQMSLTTQTLEHAQESDTLADQVALLLMEVRGLHMQRRALADRVSILEDHLTRPDVPA